MLRVWRYWTSERSIRKIVVFIIILSSFIAISLTFYSIYEGWSLNTSFYFIIVSLSTVGYGDPSPSDDWSRLFTIFFILVGVYVVFSGISDFFHSHIYWLRKYACNNDTETIHEDIVIGDIFRYRRQLTFYCTLMLLWTIIGACVMKYNEDWSWIAAFYFVAETSSTVGYGDMVPTKESSRSFITLYIILSTIILAGIIRSFNASMEEVDELDRFEEQLCQLADLESALINDKIPTTVSRDRAILEILCHTGELKYDKHIEPWVNKLDKLTINGKEPIDQVVISQLCEEERASAFRYLLELEEKKERSWACLPFQSSRWSTKGGNALIHPTYSTEQRSAGDEGDIIMGIIQEEDTDGEDDSKESESKEEIV